MSFDITFCPTSDSVKSGTININFYDPNTNNLSRSISGRGLIEADYITSLFESITFMNCHGDTPDEDKTPLILIHGIHGIEDQNDNKLLDESEEGDALDYWSSFREKFCESNGLMNKYRVYLFSYLSDIYSVYDIARSLRNNIDTLIYKGEIKDSNFVILAHSMGGLVARSYMQQHSHKIGLYTDRRGGERADLVTLATPHHGTPGANHESRYRLSLLANLRDIKYHRFWMRTYHSNFININNWSGVMLSFSGLYWHLTYGTDWDEFNRKDLLWDNFDNVMRTNARDINKWLRDQLNTDTTYDEKIIAYYGYLDTTEVKYRNIVNDIYQYNSNGGPNILLKKAAVAKALNDEHEMLLCSSILLNYGLFNNGEEYNQKVCK